MKDSSYRLGTCPFCGAAIDRGSILIEYKSGDEQRLYAECYECDEPVRPR